MAASAKIKIWRKARSRRKIEKAQISKAYQKINGGISGSIESEKRENIIGIETRRKRMAAMKTENNKAKALMTISKAWHQR